MHQDWYFIYRVVPKYLDKSATVTTHNIFYILHYITAKHTAFIVKKKVLGHLLDVRFVNILINREFVGNIMHLWKMSYFFIHDKNIYKKWFWKVSSEKSRIIGHLILSIKRHLDILKCDWNVQIIFGTTVYTPAAKSLEYYRFVLMLLNAKIRHVPLAANQYIRMISEGLCDTNGCWFSFAIMTINYNLKHIQIETSYYTFLFYFTILLFSMQQINATLASKRKILIIPSFWPRQRFFV